MAQVRTVRVMTALALAGLAAPAAAHAQKTDVVKLVNGDEITGEIKELSRGKLDYATDDAGRLSIKWTKILRLTSAHYFEVETSAGRFYYGQLRPAGADGRIAVALNRADTLPIDQIVRIVPLDTRFVRRLRAFLDAGFTVAKANRAVNLNVNTEAAYRASAWGVILTGSSYFQRQEGAAGTSRNRFALQGQRFLPRRWQAILIADGEQNEELGLLLRLSAGVGAGYTVRQTNRNDLAVGGGVVVTGERFALADTVGGASPDTVKRNIEGLVRLTWNTFRFDTPKLDLSTSLTGYPSLSSPGRVRGDMTVRVRYELFTNFYLGVNFTDTFDSRPPDAAAATNDYVTSLTIGWSYRR